MFLNEEFLRVLEELDQINESKADTRNLIDFAGEDLTNRFLKVKNRLKAPENDLYYWIKNKTPEELEKAVTSIENSKSVSQTKKDIADAGAKLIQDTEHWKVYHITTFEASQKYGRDSKWCITGIDNYGDKFWKEYTDAGITFYFIISKENYDSRGKDSKFAIAKHPDIQRYEIYNQQDERVFGKDIPYYEEISIQGVDLNHSYFGHYCNGCDAMLEDDIYEDGYKKGADGELYCDDCFDKVFFVCDDCGKTYYIEDMHDLDFDGKYCDDCISEIFDQEYDYNRYSW